MRYYQRRPWVPDKTSITLQECNVRKTAGHDEHPGKVLGSFGERTILSEIIMPRLALGKAGAEGIGDDCAEIAVPPAGHTILATIDPCPSPVVFELGDHDYWHYGRMTILINVSDLAAMGAKPIGILVSTVMPDDMLIKDYHRYLDGLVDASDEWDCPILGGNIKDGREFTSTGSAIGSAPADAILRRTGAQKGDKVCVVGRMGLFWAAVLQHLSPKQLKVSETSSIELHNALHRPTARLKEALILARSGLVTACMDASDGVGACLTELALKNGLDLVVDASRLVPDAAVDEIATQVPMDARKFMLAWGNWELVLTVRPNDVSAVERLAQVHNFPISIIGEMCDVGGTVWLSSEGKRGRLTNFASERFTGTSYFTHGLESYMRWLVDVPLTEDRL